ncbi:MAG: radical SAM protein [Nitrospinota bacterium]|nr:radical SAM protein [Nitrospinota bacterium]
MPEIAESPYSQDTEEACQPAIQTLLVYPNVEDVALANLGFQRVHALLNRIEGVACDLFSLPAGWTPQDERLDEDAMLSRNNRRLPKEFDLIAFSVSFEPDYLNVATVLHYFGIPLERKERDASYPMIVAGGSAIFINPEPLAEIMDVFFIGEAEEMAEQFFHHYRENAGAAYFLKQAATIKGIYVPQFYHPEHEGNRQIGLKVEPSLPERIDRHWVEDSGQLLTHSEMHNGTSAFKDMALMEITRGCIWACRFCTAGFIYRPPRLPDLQRTYDSLAETLEQQGQETKTIGLVGPSVTDHPELLPLAQRLVDEGKTLSFSSLRMETLTDELVDLMIRSGQKTLTVAVDAPSERMRQVVNKSATDAFIIEKCRFLTQKGILNLKIYSIIGLPGETEEDIDQFISLVERVTSGYVDASRGQGRIGKLTISLNPLIPKPGTPFQWHPMERVEVLKRRFMKIRKALGRLPNIKLSFGSPHEAYLQTYLSRGDRTLVHFFKTYLANGLDAKSALTATSPQADYFVYRQYSKNDFLPWDIIDHGYHNDFLWQDYQRGLKELATPVCDTATCKVCGVC